MVEVLLTLIVICIGAVVWYATATRRRIARLEDESRKRISQTHTQHEKRVGRLNRKLDAVSERGHLDFAADLLPALDALGHALEEANRSQDLAGVREGLEMVDRELDAILSKHGIEKCCPQPGDAFDPNVHEAVSIVEDSEFDHGCVTECFRPGYVHNDRVLRAAMVSVTRSTCTDLDDPGSDDPDSDNTTSSKPARDEPEHDEPAAPPQADTSSPEDVDDAPPGGASSLRSSRS